MEAAALSLLAATGKLVRAIVSLAGATLLARRAQNQRLRPKVERLGAPIIQFIDARRATERQGWREPISGLLLASVSLVHFAWLLRLECPEWRRLPETVAAGRDQQNAAGHLLLLLLLLLLCCLRASSCDGPQMERATANELIIWLRERA